jgi:hypothetical protein
MCVTFTRSIIGPISEGLCSSGGRKRNLRGTVAYAVGAKDLQQALGWNHLHRQRNQSRMKRAVIKCPFYISNHFLGMD